MYTISKQFTFSASHQLLNLCDSHPCYRLHGHNYIVEVELQASELNSTDTTAENLAKFLFDWAKTKWPEVTAMRVSETPKTWAEYRP